MLDDGSVDRVGHRREAHLVPEAVDPSELTIGGERQAIERPGRGIATGPQSRLLLGQTIGALQDAVLLIDIEIEGTVRRLAGPSVRDAATGRNVEIGPEIDEQRAWTEYRRRRPDRRYAVSKRRLCKAELRRHGLHDQDPDAGSIQLAGKPDRVALRLR